MNSLPMTTPRPNPTYRPGTAHLKEGTMLDRDRFLAADHEARLHAQAGARRLAASAGATRRTASSRPASGRLKAALGRRLVAIGRGLAPDPDPCGPPSARTA